MEVRLTVIAGSAQQQQLCLKKKRINLGRLAEVIDADQRLTRQNDVAFRDDGPAPNPSVSRAHAHLNSIPRRLCSVSSMIGVPMAPPSSGMAP